MEVSGMNSSQRWVAFAVIAALLLTGASVAAAKYLTAPTAGTYTQAPAAGGLVADDQLTGKDYETTFQCAGDAPWYKVWVRNSGPDDLKIDVGREITGETIAAGETKAYVFKTWLLERRVTVQITGADGADLNGKIAIKTAAQEDDLTA